MLTAEQTRRIDYLVNTFTPNPVEDAEIAEALNFTEEPPQPSRSWRDEPATPKQVRYLWVLGHRQPTANMTKYEACELISRLLREAHV